MGFSKTPSSSQQDSKGTLKGAGGEAGMGELVGLCEVVKETSEAGIVQGICGASHPDVGGRARFCRKWVVDRDKWTCGPVSHQGMPEAAIKTHHLHINVASPNQGAFLEPFLETSGAAYDEEAHPCWKPIPRSTDEISSVLASVLAGVLLTLDDQVLYGRLSESPAFDSAVELYFPHVSSEIDLGRSNRLLLQGEVSAKFFP
jgi:hypothetical protein